MATILPFKHQTVTKSVRQAAWRGADIIIFPGVRYERRMGTDAGKVGRRPIGGTPAKRQKT